jgi:myosin-5
LEEVKLRNDASESEVDNLINLPYLHEPAILYCLQCRYNSGDIYTYTGPILIAVNPFKRVPLYTPQILELYYNHGLLKSQNIENSTALPPHVYAIADSAYRDMMQVILGGLGGSGKGPAPSADQSILISGESGAGRVFVLLVSCNMLLLYFRKNGINKNCAEVSHHSWKSDRNY